VPHQVIDVLVRGLNGTIHRGTFWRKLEAQMRPRIRRMVRWGFYSAIAGAAVALWIGHFYWAAIRAGKTPGLASYSSGILAWIASFPSGLVVLYAIVVPVLARLGRDRDPNLNMTAILLFGVVANWMITGSLLSLVRNPLVSQGGAPPDGEAPRAGSITDRLAVSFNPRRMLRWALYGALTGGIVAAALWVAYWKALHAGDTPALAWARPNGAAGIASFPFGLGVLYIIVFPAMTTRGWIHIPAAYMTAVLVLGVVANWATIGALLSLLSDRPSLAAKATTIPPMRQPF
jgi:hypothetical protein